MILPRWPIAAILAVLLSCFCLPATLASQLGLNDIQQPTSTIAPSLTASYPTEPPPPDPSKPLPPDPTKPPPPTPTSTPLAGSHGKKPDPTQNPNAPIPVPAEMGTAEPIKPSLPLDLRYTDPQDLYSVEYPKGWWLSRVGKWDDICVDHEKSVCFHAQTGNYPKDGMLSTFMNNTYEIFKSSVGNYKVIKREQILICGFPAVMFEQSYTFHNEYKQGFAAYLLNRDKATGYQIQAEIVAQRQDYDLMYETLRNMVYSFCS